jgi:hypothetical protein
MHDRELSVRIPTYANLKSQRSLARKEGFHDENGLTGGMWRARFSVSKADPGFADVLTNDSARGRNPLVQSGRPPHALELCEACGVTKVWVSGPLPSVPSPTTGEATWHMKKSHH